MTKSKLSELVLYIAHRSQDDSNFGVTKLNKILFFSDFYYYGLTGKPITNSTYQHIQRGPAPKAMLPVLQQLQESERVVVKPTNFHGHKQDRVIPIDAPDRGLFDDDELRFVNYWINNLRHFNGTDLSDLTHELNPWLLTKHKEEIPYHTVFMMKDRKVEIDGHLWAKKELSRLRHNGYAY